MTALQVALLAPFYVDESHWSRELERVLAFAPDRPARAEAGCARPPLGSVQVMSPASTPCRITSATASFQRTSRRWDTSAISGLRRDVAQASIHSGHSLPLSSGPYIRRIAVQPLPGAALTGRSSVESLEVALRGVRDGGREQRVLGVEVVEHQTGADAQHPGDVGGTGVGEPALVDYLSRRAQDLLASDLDVMPGHLRTLT